MYTYLLPNNRRRELDDVIKWLRSYYGAIIMDLTATDGVILETTQEVFGPHQKTLGITPHKIAA